MYASPIRPDLTVEQLLARLPVTAVVFVRRGMSCVGCDMAVYDTLLDVAREYGCEASALLRELEAAVAASGPRWSGRNGGAC
jgi:hybrid cluster-associated redox disulfide protein